MGGAGALAETTLSAPGGISQDSQLGPPLPPLGPPRPCPSTSTARSIGMRRDYAISGLQCRSQRVEVPQKGELHLWSFQGSPPRAAKNRPPPPPISRAPRRPPPPQISARPGESIRGPGSVMASAFPERSWSRHAAERPVFWNRRTRNAKLERVEKAEKEKREWNFALPAILWSLVSSKRVRPGLLPIGPHPQACRPARG